MRTRSAPAEAERKRATKRLLLERPNDLYDQHLIIQHLLTRAGFQPRWIKKAPHHPVFTVNLRRGTFNLSPDDRQAARQFREIFAQGGMKIARDCLGLTQRRDRISLSFLYPCDVLGIFLDCVTGATGPANYFADECDALRDNLLED